VKVEDLAGKRVRLHLQGGRFVEGVCSSGISVGIRGNSFTTFPAPDKRGLYYIDAGRTVDVWRDDAWVAVEFDK
jgi:hypothetical protein